MELKQVQFTLVSTHTKQHQHHQGNLVQTDRQLTPHHHRYYQHLTLF